MNIIFHTTGGYSSSFNSKSEQPNKIIANIKRVLLLNSSHKKELWCFAFKYEMFLSLQNENNLCGDVSYFLCYGSRPLYKHIKIWCVRVYILNGRVTRKKLDYISDHGYFTQYSDTTGVIVYWNSYHPFVIHRSHHDWFDEYNSNISIE